MEHDTHENDVNCSVAEQHSFPATNNSATTANKNPSCLSPGTEREKKFGKLNTSNSTINTKKSKAKTSSLNPTTNNKSIREEERKKEGSNKPDEIVKLNIGGYIYHTYASTLTRSSVKSEGSFFTGLLSGCFGSTRDETGALFIDRDGAPFASILRYLRTGKLVIPKDTDPSSVYEEAAFYCIQLPPEWSRLSHATAPRVDGVYLDADMSLLVQFLPNQNKVKIAAKLNENLWLDFCRTNDSYFRYVVRGHYFIISPVGVQDEFSVLSGSIYTTHLQPDNFSRMSSRGRLTFFPATSVSDCGGVVAPVFGMDYILHESYSFKDEKIGERISMLCFYPDNTVSMIIKIGSQPQRIKIYRYTINTETCFTTTSAPHLSEDESNFGAGGVAPNPGAVVNPAIPNAMNAAAGEDADGSNEGQMPISKSLLREVVIRSAEDTKTDIHLICLQNNTLIDVSYFIGMKSTRTYHPRITRVFVGS